MFEVYVINSQEVLNKEPRCNCLWKSISHELCIV